MRFEPLFLDEIKSRLPVSEVVGRRVSLKKAGREWKGLSPFNKERTPSFFVNDQKQAWFDFSSGKNGNIFDFVMQVDGLTFPQAVEEMAKQAGVPLPKDANVRQRSADEHRAWEEENAKRHAEYEARKAKREMEDEMSEAEMVAAARKIWNDAVPLAGTAPERYLNRRGLPVPSIGWPDSLRAHSHLRHHSGRSFPCLVGRVDDASGVFAAVWRIYVTDGGDKAPVDDPKLGLGPAGGGSVRIGGMASKCGLAEGIESAIGAWFLIGMKHPVWACLSTSGMVSFEVPLGVDRIIIYPDGDAAKERPDGTIAEPAGIRAARTLRDPLNAIGIPCTIAPTPCDGKDYLDVWVATRAAA